MMTATNNTAMTSLNNLLQDIVYLEHDIEISGVAIDSRQVSAGDLFIAYKGSNTNGINFIQAAINSGAVAIAIDSDENVSQLKINVPLIRINHLRRNVGVIASRFFGEPSNNMNVYGVTGTNGKTTVSFMLTHAIKSLGKPATLIGTLGHGQIENLTSGAMTTPDPINLQKIFADWSGKVTDVAMEVSSHALDQARVSGTSFKTAIFTNISRDHLDYHQTLENYAAAKFSLFKYSGLKHAVINEDDEYGRQLIKQLPEDINCYVYSNKPSPVEKYTRRTISRTYCQDVHVGEQLTELQISSPWGNTLITTPLVGEFNIHNLLAVFTALCANDYQIDEVARVLSCFKGVPGRMETFASDKNPLLVVDYAHTPDALEKALISLRPICKGKLICVFGCGGDRDKGKRPMMGKLAEKHADHVVLTNDNPRHEEPESIIKDILSGLSNPEQAEIHMDRSDAITNAFLAADSSDIILIAGKGHETTQQIGDQIYPFCDRELARRLSRGDA